MIVRGFVLLLMIAALPVLGAEEELSLDKITDQVAPVVIQKTPEPKFTFMGRLDLTAEVNSLQKKSADNKSEFKNLHGLRLFLKLKASPKTSFFGEMANQNFYYVDYTGFEKHTISFGKILVPFGDTRYFHHFYGGIQGKGTEGLLLPNVWAEPGVNVQCNAFENAIIEAYVVNGIKGSPDTDFPDLKKTATQTAANQRQALGARLQWVGLDHMTFIGSAYFDYYLENRRLTLLGGDFYTDYGLWKLPVRVGMGIADASAEKVQDKGTLQRRGDYLLVAGNGFGPGEWRVRYGTYNHITKEASEYDTHSFDLAYSWNVDVIRVMVERQWNFEPQNEQEDDVLRFMASLDF